jgi:hypothetical protein
MSGLPESEHGCFQPGLTAEIMRMIGRSERCSSTAGGCHGSAGGPHSAVSGCGAKESTPRDSRSGDDGEFILAVEDGGVPTYDFGAVRVATFALLTFTALSGSRCCGVVTAKFSGHAVIFRSSPTVFGDGWMPGSTSTRILSGRPPRATWSAAMLLGLYRMSAPSFSSTNR